MRAGATQANREALAEGGCREADMATEEGRRFVAMADKGGGVGGDNAAGGAQEKPRGGCSRSLSPEGLHSFCLVGSCKLPVHAEVGVELPEGPLVTRAVLRQGGEERELHRPRACACLEQPRGVSVSGAEQRLGPSLIRSGPQLPDDPPPVLCGGSRALGTQTGPPRSFVVQLACLLAIRGVFLGADDSSSSRAANGGRYVPPAPSCCSCRPSCPRPCPWPSTLSFFPWQRSPRNSSRGDRKRQPPCFPQHRTCHGALPLSKSPSSSGNCPARRRWLRASARMSAARPRPCKSRAMAGQSSYDRRRGGVSRVVAVMFDSNDGRKAACELRSEGEEGRAWRQVQKGIWGGSQSELPPAMANWCPDPKQEHTAGTSCAQASILAFAISQRTSLPSIESPWS